MAISGLLGIARSALLVHRRAMEVTGHNVSNAMTPGYRRQRLVVTSDMALQPGLGSMGRGVRALGIEQARDRFLDFAVRRENSALGDAAARSDMLGAIEAMFAEPSEDGVGASIDAFFASFGDLANDPSSGPNRELVRQAASRLAGRLRGLDTRLTQAMNQAGERIAAQVGEVNEIAARIAELNHQIRATGGAQGLTPDLVDAREALVDRLSGLVGVRAEEQPDGSILVLSGDGVLVDAGGAHPLEVRPRIGGGFDLVPAGGGAPIRAQGGSLAGLHEMTNVTLPGFRARLDEFASELVQQVNAIHRLGYTPGDQTGIDLFDPAGTTAGSSDLSSDVKASADAIASSSIAGASDGEIALRLSALGRAAIAAFGGRTLRDHYAETAGLVGLAVRGAREEGSAAELLLMNAESRRQSVQGVSVDEEMVGLVAQQQAYQAAARLVTAAEEMLDVLMRM